MIAELKTRLSAELERLSAEQTGRMTESFAMSDEVRTIGEEAKDRSTQRRMAALGQLVAGLATVDPAKIWRDRAGFGSVVRVRDTASGEESTYTLMTGDLVELDEGHVSLESPIGHALLGRRQGDRVRVTTPRGERSFEILSLATLPARVGLGEPPATSAAAGAEARVA